ncbi:MAG: hypothetical protein JWQ14_163 [Adhaeribacter sp.]|nr:hypothetical protein [Adhaeribacter sp.]
MYCGFKLLKRFNIDLGLNKTGVDKQRKLSIDLPKKQAGIAGTVLGSK